MGFGVDEGHCLLLRLAWSWGGGGTGLIGGYLLHFLLRVPVVIQAYSIAKPIRLLASINETYVLFYQL